MQSKHSALPKQFNLLEFLSVRDQPFTQFRVPVIIVNCVSIVENNGCRSIDEIQLTIEENDYCEQRFSIEHPMLARNWKKIINNWYWNSGRFIHKMRNGGLQIQPVPHRMTQSNGIFSQFIASFLIQLRDKTHSDWIKNRCYNYKIKIFSLLDWKLPND